MQILYLVGVALLLTFDLLACADSQGMLYQVLMPKCNTTCMHQTNWVFDQMSLPCFYLKVVCKKEGVFSEAYGNST